MDTLSSKIENATSTEELELIVASIPKQENGNRSQLAGVLENTFWYCDLNTVAKQKTFMLTRVNSGLFN